MKKSDFNYDLEIKFSKTGLPIPLVNGTHLHSNYNPEREAEGFVTQNEGIISRSGRILLFGLGFGYHIHQLEFKLKMIYGETYSVYIIEPNQNVYQECLRKKLCSPNNRIKIFCKNLIQDYFQDVDLINFMSERPTVLPHPASFGLYKSFFKAFMGYKAPKDINSMIHFVESTHLKNYLETNHANSSIEEIYNNISKKEYLLKIPDHLFLALKGMSADSENKKIT